MKEIKLIIIALLMTANYTFAQNNNLLGVKYTSKFIGNTIDLNFEHRTNRYSLSGGLLFYTNQKAESTYTNAKKDYPLSPFHFDALRDEAYADNFIRHFGVNVSYNYFIKKRNTVNPYIYLGVAVSYVGFELMGDLPAWDPPRLIVDCFPGVGLNIKLIDKVYLNQSISPGILFIDFYPYDSFSINPSYSVGLFYKL